jgi:hypothetical protein
VDGFGVVLGCLGFFFSLRRSLFPILEILSACGESYEFRDKPLREHGDSKL